jgi:hypothetical protein
MGDTVQNQDEGTSEVVVEDPSVPVERHIIGIGKECSVCNLDAKPRKIGEYLLQQSVGVRDVADFTDWWAAKYSVKSATKSAWSRHKVSGHFEMRPKVTVDTGDAVLDLDELVDRLFGTWQKANKGTPVTAKELREWLKLRATIRADIERREGDRDMTAMLMGAAHQEKEGT